MCSLPQSTMPSLLDSQPQIPAAGAWDSLYDVQEPVKPRHTMVVAAAAVAKKPVYYGGRTKKNLETCTEALGCETGGVDAAPASNGADKFDGEEVEAERKRRAREEEEQEQEMEMEGRARQAARQPLPPPLTTLACGASRVRMVHERRDGRLAVYAVRAPGVEAERSGGRLRMRLVALPCGPGSATACRRQEPQEADAKEEVEEAECGVVKYVRGGRCVQAEGGAAVARRGKLWEPEQAAAFRVATS